MHDNEKYSRKLNFQGIEKPLYQGIVMEMAWVGKVLSPSVTTFVNCMNSFWFSKFQMPRVFTISYQLKNPPSMTRVREHHSHIPKGKCLSASYHP
jgi:hypothetical protein